MIDRHIAFFPDNTPLHEGRIEMLPETDPERGKSQTRVVTDDPNQTLIMESGGTYTTDGTPTRKDFVGYFVRLGGTVRCSVDLEATPKEDISLEIIARAMLASDWADEKATEQT